MCRSRIFVLMGLVGVIAASPAMAFDFKVDLNFGRGKHRNVPVVVTERHHAPIVVVEKSHHPVIVARPHVEITHIVPPRSGARHEVIRPHGPQMIVRTRH